MQTQWYAPPQRHAIGCMPVLAALLLFALLVTGGLALVHPPVGAHARALGSVVLAAPVAPTPLVLRLVADGSGDPDVPIGSPLRSPHAVMTQGYGVGSHAPANIWGAVDLAIDGDGDGQADPGASQGAPIYATQRGTVTLSPNSYPAGNHVWVRGEHFSTGYSHLQDFAPGVQDGQTVEARTLLGHMGATGAASGPHLDYQVWKDGVNVNPLDYGAANTGEN